MKIGDKVTTLTGVKGVISQIEKKGNNTVITFEDRSCYLKSEIKEVKKKKKE